MNRMFCGAKTFNQPLQWVVANVQDMGAMFYGALEFNQPLETWDVSYAEDSRKPSVARKRSTSRERYRFSATGANEPLALASERVGSVVAVGTPTFVAVCRQHLVPSMSVGPTGLVGSGTQPAGF